MEIDLNSTKAYWYDLPEELIAQTPLEKRDTSRLCVLNRETGAKIYTLDMAMAGNSYFDAMYHNIDTIKEALE